MKKIFFKVVLLFIVVATQTTCIPDLAKITNHFVQDSNLEYTIQRSFKQTTKKPWTVLVYAAADNDLAPFARKNIIQLARKGSTKFVNLLVHLDILLPGKRKTTLRYYVEKDKLIVTNHNDPTSQAMDSGNPETLISALEWATQNFPSDNIMLDLWNHGIGILDVGRPRTIDPSELFIFNSTSNMLDLDRSVPFLDFISTITQTTGQRGICFDDSTGNYLNNTDLVHALETVQKKCLNGKKINIICFDACLMAMLEVANLLKPYADYMVASQEVELGSGYDYERVASIFQNHAPDAQTLSKHIVQEYEHTYERITNDYTQSALDLNKIAALENAIDIISELLINALKQQQGQSVKNAIKSSRHKLLCTHFDEPSYIDLHHFLSNMQTNMHHIKCADSQFEYKIKTTLNSEINRALKLINAIVFANATGKNLMRAHGISIYFPEFKLHTSYRKTPFAAQNKWAHLLTHYIAA